MLLSVVIPTLNEAVRLPALLHDLNRLQVPHEVIVADGGSADATVELSGQAGAKVVKAPAGRGRQLRAGAERACAPLLCFLHADVRLTEVAVLELERLAASPPTNACAFRLRIDSGRLAFRVLEAGANMRSRVFGMPYGDQGLVISREAYWQVGGYPDTPLMEDVALVRALRRTAGVRLLDAHLLVSARRWERDGIVRRTATNLTLLVRYLTGTHPERLVARYRPESSAP